MGSIIIHFFSQPILFYYHIFHFLLHFKPFHFFFFSSSILPKGFPFLAPSINDCSRHCKIIWAVWCSQYLIIWALSSNQSWAENSNQILSKEALSNQEGEIYEVCCWGSNFRNWGIYLRAIIWITWTTTGSILGSNLFATIWFCWFTCDCHLLVGIFSGHCPFLSL